jgi:hypothetical protein
LWGHASRLEKVTSKKLHIKTEAKFRTSVTVPCSRIRSKCSRQSVAALLIGKLLTHKRKWCAWQDSNLRPFAPEATRPDSFHTHLPFPFIALHQFGASCFRSKSNPFPVNFLEFWNTFGTAAAFQSKTPGPPVAPLPPNRDVEPQSPLSASGKTTEPLGPRFGRPKRTFSTCVYTQIAYIITQYAYVSNH